MVEKKSELSDFNLPIRVSLDQVDHSIVGIPSSQANKYADSQMRGGGTNSRNMIKNSLSQQNAKGNYGSTLAIR